MPIATPPFVALRRRGLSDRARGRRPRATCRATRSSRCAVRAGAEAIHPGFGFLAENSGFARACAAAGVTFVGPAARGDGRDGVEDQRPAGDGRGRGADRARRDRSRREGRGGRRIAAEIGYPIAIKAAAGGGGKGIKVVRARGRLVAGYESARREGAAYFADDTVYIERYLDDPRHIEVQVLADEHGDGGAPGRAGLLDPAAAPEDRGGDALAGGHAGAARGDREDRGRRGARRSGTPTRARSRDCWPATAPTTSSR